MKRKIITVLLLSFFLCQFFLTGCFSDRENNEFIVNINGESVSLNEYLLYLFEAENNFEDVGGEDIWDTDFDGQSAENVAKDSALKSLRLVKITAQKAKELNITLTEEEMNRAKEDAAFLKDSFTDAQKNRISITDDEIIKAMEEKALYGKVYEELTKNYVVSPAAFDAYYKEYAASYRQNNMLLTLKKIVVPDETAADDIHKRLAAGEDFDALFEARADKKLSGDGNLEVTRSWIDATFSIAFDLKEGEVSNVLEGPDGYYIFKVLKETPAGEEELKEAALRDYRTMMQQQLFAQEYDKWQNAAKIERNDALWDTIRITKNLEKEGQE